MTLPAMQLNYSLNKRDILFARIMLMFQNKILLISSFLVMCLFSAALSTGDEARKYSVAVRIITAIVSFGFSAVLYFGIMLILNWIIVWTGKLAGVIGPHTLEIKDEGLEERTALNKGLHRWNASFRVKEFGNYVWIYPTDERFFLVPTKQGRYEGDLKGFVTQLTAKIKLHAAASV